MAQAETTTAPDAPPRRERQDAVKNRARILAVAQELFDAHGVAAVSMNRIAQESGIGAGTLYRHFSGKSELCLSLMQDRIATFADELSTLVATQGDDDPRATFQTMILAYLRFKESKAALFEGMEQAAVRTSGLTASPVYALVRQPFIDLFAETGSGHVDPSLRADLLLTALIGDSMRRIQQVHHLASEQLAANIAEVFWPRG